MATVAPATDIDLIAQDLGMSAGPRSPDRVSPPPRLGRVGRWPFLARCGGCCVRTGGAPRSTPGGSASCAGRTGRCCRAGIRTTAAPAMRTVAST